MNSFESNRKPWITPVMVEGKALDMEIDTGALDMEIDTGASVSLISESRGIIASLWSHQCSI